MKREAFSDLRTYDFQEFRLSPGKKTEVRGYFTNSRVDPDSLPEKWNMYEIMGTENGNIGRGIIKKRVGVNFVGTFLVYGELKLTRPVINEHDKVVNHYRGVGSYTFGFDDDPVTPLDTGLVNSLLLVYQHSKLGILELIKEWVKVFPALTSWDAECLIVKSGEDISDEQRSDFVRKLYRDLGEKK